MQVLRGAYRHLLRAALPAVRYSRTAARSVRQLLRADAEQAMHVPAAAWQPYAERTMALFVLTSLSRRPVHGPEARGSSVWRPSSTSRAATLARRTLYHLVSLAYHHVSPHTLMQPRRGGGSSADTMPKAPSVLQDKETDAPDIAPVYPRVLRVPPKPVRGPLHHRPPYWDGQRPEKHMRDASATTNELQERLTQLGEEWELLSQSLGAEHKHAQAVRHKYIHLRGTLKTMRRAAEQQREQDTLRQCPVDMLHDVVSAAADSETLWLGTPRWTRWRRGEFLPP